MPIEPNQKMHELLEACARQQQQRAVPPLEMHPATRRLLQAEVRRVYPGPSSTATGKVRSLFTGFWPGMALTASLALLIVPTVLLLLWPDNSTREQLAESQSNKTLLAKDDSVRDQNYFDNDAADRAAQRLGLAAGLETPASQQPQLKTQRAEERFSRLDVAAAPAPQQLDPEWVSNAPRLQYGLPPVPGPRPAIPPQAASAPDILQSSRGFSVAARETALPPTPPPKPDIEGTPVGFFSQVDPQARYRQNLNSPPNPQVLTTFQLLQSGEIVRIIDADGSIYEGTLRPAQAGQAFSFRAAGTNRTLNQLVVFTGDFQPAAHEITLEAGRAHGGAAGAGIQQGRPVQSQPTSDSRLGGQSRSAVIQQQTGRIEGRATVGKSEFRIEAVPVKP
jgi:hypothetical protein